MRRGRCKLRYLGVVLALWWGPEVLGQFKFRPTPNSQDAQTLDSGTAAQVWARLLAGVRLGTVELRGDLRYRRSGQATQTYLLTLHGTEDGDWQRVRVGLVDPLTGAGGRVTFRYMAGRTEILDEAGEWVASENPWARRVYAALPLTIADLSMPYLYWKDRTYLGGRRYLGRPAHAYALNAEDEATQYEVWVDEDYAALLSVYARDAQRAVLGRVRVGGFKKFGEYWGFSELIWERRAERESIVLEVRELQVYAQ